MMLKLTFYDRDRSVFINYKNISAFFGNLDGSSQIYTIGDSNPYLVKEAPDEIIAQIEYVKATELGIERIFKNPMYNADLMLDMMTVLTDVQRLKNNRNFEL